VTSGSLIDSFIGCFVGHPAVFLHVLGGFGIAGGVHKLWSHRSYNASLPLRILIAVAQTIAHQVWMEKIEREKFRN
jgi:stearoyl-CoA desaturase (delta-9 desaturase)